jgi:hypothetical protein
MFRNLLFTICFLCLPFACVDVERPVAIEPVDPEIDLVAHEVARAFGLAGTAFLQNEIVKIDTVTYRPVYTRAFLEKIDFNNIKMCCLYDSLPYIRCIGHYDSIPEFNGFIKVEELSTSFDKDNEFIELYFAPSRLSSLVASGCPDVLKKVVHIEDAYVRYYGSYVGISNYSLDYFRCNRFSATVFPKYSANDTLGFVELFDSFLVDLAVGDVFRSQTWESWISDSVKVLMGFSANTLVDVPVKFMRKGKYVNEYAGCKANSLVDSLIFTSSSMTFVREADSIDIYTGTPSVRWVKVKTKIDNSFECAWTSGVKQTFSTGTGFRNSNKTFPDESIITVSLDTNVLSSRRLSSLTEDSIRFVLFGDTLTWNRPIDSSAFSGKLYWSFRQVCSKFEVAEAGISGWATFNPWTESGKCYVKSKKGIIYLFNF